MRWTYGKYRAHKGDRRWTITIRRWWFGIGIRYRGQHHIGVLALRYPD